MFTGNVICLESINLDLIDARHRTPTGQLIIALLLIVSSQLVIGT